MQQFASVASGVADRSPVNWSSVFKTTDISPRVQQHLANVYATLAMTLATTFVGVVCDLRFGLGGALSSIAGLMLVIALAVEDKSNVDKRLKMLGGFGFLQGLSLGPLINLALQIDPSIVVTAILGTTTIFACFSLSALYSQRRSWLYLGGTLASALSFMSLLSLVSIFWRPVFIFNIQLYFGLAVFALYVIYDTQLIVEKAELGSSDFVSHALELFVDFVAVFVRVLIILIKNSQEKEDKKKKSDRR